MLAPYLLPLGGYDWDLRSQSGAIGIQFVRARARQNRRIAVQLAIYIERGGPHAELMIRKMTRVSPRARALFDFVYYLLLVLIFDYCL
jgi:hypothetical protein